MLTRMIAGIVLLLTLVSCTTARADVCVPGEVLVQLTPGTDITAFNRTYGTQTLASSSFTSSYRLCVSPNTDVEALAARMSQDSRVVAASANLCNMALFTETLQWAYAFNSVDGPNAYTGQPSVAQVGYGPIAARFSGAGVVVAVLDTGISRRNPALAAQVANGWNFVANNGDADDRPSGLDANGNGVPDEAAGHGTMVAGLVARFAPGTTLLPVKVLNSDGTGDLWSVVEGIHYAIARGARVLNLSFGSTEQSDLLDEAIAEAYDSGAVIVSAAGNNNTDNPQSPAGDPHVLGVAALNTDNTKAVFSNYGKTIDVDAPGVNIVSTYWDGTYAVWSGTSFSAPMVSAEAALILLARPRAKVKKVMEQIIRSSHSVNEVNPGYRNLLGKHGTGLIDMDAALSDFDD